MVERRDQVRSTFFSLRLFMSSIVLRRCVSANGSFFVERPIINSRFLYRLSSPYCCKYFVTTLELVAVFLLAAAAHNKFVCPLIVACLVAARRLPPRSHRMAPA